RLRKQGAIEVDHDVRMERSIDRMERLINDVLDVSRIESGRLVLRRQRCDLVAICAQTAERQIILTERPITLRLPEMSVLVEADPERIGQVIANLLSNALKYSTFDRPVTLDLATAEDWAIVSVQDEGGGIAPEARQHLFERFYRVPGAQVLHGS